VRGIRGEPVCINLKSAIAHLKSSEAWHLPIGLGANLGERAEKPLGIEVFAKDRLTAVATIHHRITRARIFEPTAARQDEFSTATPHWCPW
jgi:hypothetical protein